MEVLLDGVAKVQPLPVPDLIVPCESSPWAMQTISVEFCDRG